MRALTDPWGRALSDNEAVTVRRLAGLTGRPAGEIVRMANRTRLAQAEFQMAVAFATAEWEFLDGETGEWFRSVEEQDRRLRWYAARLNDPEL